MGILTKLLGLDPVNIADGVANVIDRFIETPDEKREALAAIRKGTNEINALAAGHRSAFVAGSSPAILWICAISLFFFYVPQYMLASILWVKVSWAAQVIQPYPVSADGILELVAALTGLGVLRSIEKISGRAK